MRLRFKLLFYGGIAFFLVVILLSGWSLYQLRSGIELRKHSYSMQAKLDHVLEALQEADISFLLIRETRSDQELKNFLSLINKAHKDALDLTHMASRYSLNAEIESEIFSLEALIHEKVDILSSYSVDADLLELPTINRILTFRDDLILTQVIRDKINKLDTLFDSHVRQHQGFVDKYFNIAMGTIIFGVIVAFLLFMTFANLVSKEIERRIKLEADLVRAQEAAISASNLKSQFLATVSHEVRTPLNGIIGMSELIRERATGEVRRFASIIHDSGRGLLRIVNDILDFSKIEANKIELELQEVKVSQILETAVELFGGKVNEKKLTLTCSYEPILESHFVTDGARLSQIVLNLLGNAIKFTDRGSIEIRGQTLHRDRDLVTVRIEISDTGTGIPANKQSLLFQPFHQVEQHHQKEGTGLGLSISKRLVETMGGDIYFTSEAGKGSKFWFEIPMRLQHREAEKMRLPFTNIVDLHRSKNVSLSLKEFSEFHNLSYAKMELPVPISQDKLTSTLICCDGEAYQFLPDEQRAMALIIDLPPQQYERFLPLPFTFERFKKFFAPVNTETPIREPSLPKEMGLDGGAGLILLIEDNPTNQILAQTQLEQLGYRVHVATNGKEGLEALDQIRYDLVLMDCRMPIMDGFEATKMIRERERTSFSSRTPVIAMTANALETDRNKCLAAGMDDYIMKPFDLATLHSLIQKWLGSPKSEIDWTVMITLSNKTNRDVVRRLIDSFKTTLDQFLPQLKNQFESHQWAEVASLMHQLKSSAAALGAISFSKLCAEIEHDIEENKVPLHASCSQILEKMEKLISELNSQSKF